MSGCIPLAATALWALSSVPLVFAEVVCHTTLSGLRKCHQEDRNDSVVKIVIGVVILVAILLPFGIRAFIQRRRARQAAARTYAVDANQIYGPSFGPAPPAYGAPGTVPNAYIPNWTTYAHEGNPYDGQPQKGPSAPQYPEQAYSSKGYF